MVYSKCPRSILAAPVVALAVLFAFGYGTPRSAHATEAAGLPQQAGDVKVQLDEPLQIASSRKKPSMISATLEFRLADVPNPAKLEMLVTGLESACPVATQPQGGTELFVNGHRVRSFTLGPSGMGRSHRVVADLDPARLRAGGNSLVISGAPCTYGNFEVVRISDVVIRTAP